METLGRLIIVDDEPVILRLLSNVFEGEPYEVVSCSNGTDAMHEINKGVDVLLTDKNLPDIGGLELLAHAKRTHPECEVLLITGYASFDTVLKAMHLDAFDYIVKPPRDVFEVKRKVGVAFKKSLLARENKELLQTLRERNEALESALQELKTMQAELIQSEKLAGIGTLAAGIAHEISSPLFGVMGLAEAIIDEDDTALSKGYAREIVDYSRNIKDIVVQLTGYSRMAEHDYPEAVVLRNIIQDAVRLVVRSTAAQSVEIEVHCDDKLVVRAKATELQQVFVNLIKNSIEAIADHPLITNGKINVRCEDRQGVWIEVEDNGGGISSERIGSIFDPFYTTKAPDRGTGLGLNIVYRIITKYRGTIQVESTKGEGTTFHLRFPPVAARE